MAELTLPGDIPGERWLPVPGMEGAYEVSDMGRVRSLDRLVVNGPRGATRPLRGRVLRIHLAKGYPSVSLGASRKACVHTLVLLAFVGPRPDGMECCHWNGDPTDNRLQNLRWDTSSNNKKDGPTPLRYAASKWRFSPEERDRIRLASSQGKSTRSLARELECSESVVRRVLQENIAGRTP